MARKNESFLETLTFLPWWVSVTLSGASYLALKYIIPSMEIQQKESFDMAYIYYKAIANISPILAPYVALVLLIPAPISAIRFWRKRKLLDDQDSIDSIRQLSWKEFEELVGEAYRRLGYAVGENPGAGPDEGIDLVLRKNNGLILVQCKHWKANKVGVDKVRELYGVQASKKASRSILITSGFFTQEAKNFATDKAIDLVEGDQLLKLTKNLQFHRKGKSAALTSALYCPKCGSEMVLRTARKGPKAGQQFWGCSRFPKCRITKPCDMN
jgi:restriction system protein